jgi:ADP-heptose:LPS heptosyltransferase
VDLVNEIVSLAQDNKIKAAPHSSSYTEFASELSSCEYVVATDTSALHLASAMGIPVVGLYLTHSPEEHYWKPLGAPYEMIIKDSLIYIEAEEVVDALETLHQKTETQKELVMEEAL